MENYREKNPLNTRMSAAGSDAQEAKRLRSQLMEYDGYLQEMRKSNLKNVETLDVIQRYTDKSAEGIQSLTEESAEGIQKLLDESLQGIQMLTQEGTAGVKQNTVSGKEHLKHLSEESISRITALAQAALGQMNCLSEESLSQLQQLSEDSQTQLRALVGESIARMEEMNRRNEEIAHHVEEIREMLVGQTMSFQEMHRASDEFSHKENVKVYRNVQAVVVEEGKKQTDDLKKSWKGVKPLQVITLLASLANVGLLIFLMLSILGVSF